MVCLSISISDHQASRFTSCANVGPQYGFSAARIFGFLQQGPIQLYMENRFLIALLDAREKAALVLKVGGIIYWQTWTFCNLQQ
jgi:hypothetical protein